MMGFATMKEALVEDKIIDEGSKSKFFEKVKSTCGDNLAKLNEAKKLYSEAVNSSKETDKKKKIEGPYAKVGVVNGKLVFRVKHKGGHFGDEDIILSAQYAEANAEPEVKESKKGEVMGKLDSSAGKPSLTAAWWVKARGGLTETWGMEKILIEYESAEAALSQAQNYRNHNAMAEVMRKLTASASNVNKGFKSYKNDEAILKAFLAQVANAKTYTEDKAKRYDEAVRGQVQFNQGDAEGIYKLDRIDEQIKGVIGNIKAPTKKSMNDADGNLLGIRANLANANKAIKTYKRSAPLKNMVDDADVLRIEGDSLQKILDKGLKELKMREQMFKQLEKQVEQAMDQVLIEDAKTPKDPTYQKILDEVIEIYDKVTSDLKNVIPSATQAASNAKSTVVLPTKDEEIQGALDSVDGELKKIKNVKQQAADIFSSTRQQGEGSKKAQELENEDLIHTRKRTTEAKMVNKKVNEEVNKGVEHMLGVLGKIEQMTGASAHTDQIGKLKIRLEKELQEMNAF